MTVVKIKAKVVSIYGKIKKSQMNITHYTLKMFKHKKRCYSYYYF